MDRWWRRMTAWLRGRSPYVGLPASGRSSVEPSRRTVEAAGAWGYTPPPFSFQLLDTLERLWVENPVFSQSVKNMRAVVNPGHSLTVEGLSDRQTDIVLEDFNALAARIHPSGVGGLIDLMTTQLTVFGAASVEDVVNVSDGRVERVVSVPVRAIRFRYDAARDAYEPHQRDDAAPGGLLRLHPETYRYLAAECFDHSPYAKPPASAAVHVITEMQAAAFENVRKVLQKSGLLGLVVASLTPPPRKPGETEAEYQARAGAYLRGVHATLTEKLGETGTVTAYRDQTIKHEPIAAMMSGAGDLLTYIEQQAMSGLGQAPVFFGRSDSSTESFAEVVYQLLLAQAKSYQRLIAARLERTFLLQAQFSGLPAAPRVTFHPFQTRRPDETARAEQTRLHTAIEKARAGLISPDSAARELGYDYWHDESRLNGAPPPERPPTASAVRVLRATARGYEFVRPTLTVTGALQSEAEIDARLEQYIRRLLDTLRPLSAQAREAALDRLRAWLATATPDDFPSPEAFAAEALRLVESAYQGRFASARARTAVEGALREAYEFFRLFDRAPFGGGRPPVAMTFGDADRRTLAALSRVEQFFLGRYVQNDAPALRRVWEREYVARGAALFGRGTPADRDEFRAVSEAALKATDRHLAVIAHQATQRARNWGHLRALGQGRFAWAVIVATLDARTTPACRALDGVRIRVGTALAALDRQTALTAERFAEEQYYGAAAQEVRRDPAAYFAARVGADGVLDEATVAAGFALPPYHVLCRTRIRGEF